MPDENIKKKLRRTKARIRSTLTLAGYTVYSVEDGLFHLIADSPDNSKRIRISFGSSDIDEVRAVSRAPVPPNCYREIWQLSDDGKRLIPVKVDKSKN